MLDKAFDFQYLNRIGQAGGGDRSGDRRLASAHQRLAQFNNIPMRLRDQFIALALLCFVLRGRAFQLLRFATGALYLPDVVLTLPPAK